jgi:hypothetical protein
MQIQLLGNKIVLHNKTTYRESKYLNYIFFISATVRLLWVYKKMLNRFYIGH